MKNKKILLTFFITIILLLGGFTFWKNQNVEKKFNSHLNQGKKEILDTKFPEAKTSIKKAKYLRPQDATASLYKKQVDEVLTYQRFVKKIKLDSADQSITQLNDNPKLVPELKDYVVKEKQRIDETKEKIIVHTQSLDQARELQAQEKYEEANKVLTDVLADNENPFFSTLQKKAKALKKQNDNGLEKASKLESNKALSQEEANSILKTNLPDFFDNTNYSWEILEMEDKTGWRFSGISTSSFRANVYVTPIDAAKVKVIFEKSYSYTPDIETTEYTFERGEKNTKQEDTQGNSTRDLLETTTSQKYLNAYQQYSAQGINVLDYNRGSPVVLPESVDGTGLSEKQFALYLQGIDDYYGALKKEGHISEEQFMKLTKEAKDNLYSGAYAKNNDTFPE